MTKNQQDNRANAMYKLYCEGYSLSQVGQAYGVTRQSVYAIFKSRSFKIREKKQLPYIVYGKRKYTLDADGYYRLTTHRVGIENYLHRLVWAENNGAIPNDCEIHHKNGNKTDNRIDNLECLTASAHAQIHHSPTPIELKSCLHCGATMELRYFSNNRREEPSQYTKRLYCGKECCDKDKVGKPKNWSPRNE